MASSDIIDYHERSKHHINRYAPGPTGLDWANQPDPFRVFAGAPTLKLPPAADALSTSFNAMRRGALPQPHASCALNSGSVTTAPCIVHLQVAGLRVGEESFEHRSSLSASTDFGINHHVLRVEGADRQKPRRKYFWDGVDSLEGLISDLANVDGMRRAIWRICRLVLEIEK
jgi:hypothetical protein